MTLIGTWRYTGATLIAPSGFVADAMNSCAKERNTENAEDGNLRPMSGAEAKKSADGGPRRDFSLLPVVTSDSSRWH